MASPSDSASSSCSPRPWPTSTPSVPPPSPSPRPPPPPGTSARCPEAVVSIRNEQRRSSRDTNQLTISAVEEQRSMLQAAYDDLGENDGSMKADLQILLDRMDRQLHRIRERQRIAQSRIPCLQCLPCVRCPHPTMRNCLLTGKIRSNLSCTAPASCAEFSKRSPQGSAHIPRATCTCRHVRHVADGRAPGTVPIPRAPCMPRGSTRRSRTW